MSWENVPSSTGRMIEKTLSTWILEELKKQDTGKSETREIPHIYISMERFKISTWRTKGHLQLLSSWHKNFPSWNACNVVGH